MKTPLLLPFALLALLPIATGCASFVAFDVVITDETVVEEGGGLGSGLAALGFTGFNSFDIESSEEFENRGITREHVQEATLTRFTLTAEEPASGNLGFLDEFSLLVDAPAQNETEIADVTIEGEPQEVAANTVDDNLAAYLRTESFSLQADVSGVRPDETTTVRAVAVLRVVADPSGASTDPVE